MTPKELKEFLKKELPDVELIIKADMPKRIAGRFHIKEGKKSIILHPDYQEDASVIAHEIAHAIEHKRKGYTSHRDRWFWQNMEQKLGVELIKRRMIGNRMFSTVVGQEIKIREPLKSGKYHLYCSSHCGWEQYSNRQNRFNQNPNNLYCPRCSSKVFLEVLK